METNKVAAGGVATVGLTAVGAGVGRHIGNVKADKVLGNLKNLTKDEYVNSRLEANMENIHNSVRKSKWAQAFTKVTEKATQDFDAITERAKQAKGKWAIALGAAGLAIGAIATAIIAKSGSQEDAE